MDVADLLDGEDRLWAKHTHGYRGVPTTELAHALHRTGLTVEVVTTAQEVDEPKIVEGPDFRLLVAPQRGSARERAFDLFRTERRGLTQLLALTNAALIHALWTYEFAWAALATRRKVIVTAHDAPLTILRQMHDAYRAARTSMAYVVRLRVRHLIAVSPYLAEQWRREMLYRRPIAVIPNIAPGLGADGAISFKSNGPLVVDVTDAGPNKNVFVLVKAVQYLRARGSDVELALVGPGLSRADPFPRRLLNGNGTDGIHFFGPLERGSIKQLLREARVFAHPSREESFGLSLAEAMRLGVPVVGGAHSGAVPWLLENGRSGLLVDVNDPIAIGDAIERILKEPGLATDLANAAKSRAKRDFAPEAVVAGHLQEYDRVIVG